MPRTRNVARSQWEAANNSSNSTRTRSRNENSIDENEKENAGRQSSRATRAQARTGGRTGLLGASNVGVLGTTTAMASKAKGEKTAAKLKTASKGKEVPPPAPVRRKKQPLQDITAEFLPAQAESANRGEDVTAANEEEAGSETNAIANVVVATRPPSENTRLSILPPKFTSPLPPSSPPSEFVISPSLHPTSSAPNLLDAFHFSSTQSIPQEPYAPWQEFDDAHLGSEGSVGKVSSGSDPFGFVSLERKLKVEREAAAAILVSEQDQEEAALVLVADTSSPRPVRRLKRPLEVEAELPEAVEEVHHRLHYATPPTPHKDKQKRRRMSHEGHDVFSPCSSSVEPSPSPTKASARKRVQPALSDDPLDKFNGEFDRSFLSAKNLKAGSSKKEDNAVDPDAVSRNLRSREKLQRPLHLETEEDRRHERNSDKVVVKGKGKSAKKPVSKSRSATSKKNAKDGGSDAEKEHEDLDEKWERERQERVEYFKRLETYEVEKEDVFLI